MVHKLLLCYICCASPHLEMSRPKEWIGVIISLNNSLCFQHYVYDGVRRGLPSQRGGETKAASDRAHDVGQSY